MANKKKNVTKKTISPKMKVLLISLMSVVVAFSIVTSVVFGFKLHLYGKEFSIKFDPNGGEVTPRTMVVEFGKEYSLPKASKNGEVFAYWRIKGEQTKVKLTGRWKIGEDITLVAVWQSEVGENDKDWTGNY